MRANLSMSVKVSGSARRVMSEKSEKSEKKKQKIKSSVILVISQSYKDGRR